MKRPSLTKKLFGTDGIRGIAGTFPLDPRTVNYIGLAVGEHLTHSNQSPRVLLGRDTRESGEWIANSLISSLIDAGVRDIRDLAIITTPGLAFLTRLHQFDLGIMISASHNPYQDNGIKIFSKDGFKLSDELECDLEKRIGELTDSKPRLRKFDMKGSVSNSEGLVDDYVEFLTKHFKGDLTPFRIGLDVCNGSAFSIGPEVFRRLGANVELINHTPDGKNINDGCGSLYLDGLIALVKRLKLDYGIAFDGDADRSLFVASSGKIFDGDHVLYAFSHYFRQTGTLRSQKVVGTLMTNFALERALRMEGLELIRAAVGDKYVLEEMIRVGANLGGEPSGHVILRDYHTTGDGILTAVKLAEVLSRRSVSLEDLTNGFRPFPQVLEALRIRQKVPLSNLDGGQRAIESAERQLGDAGRIVVRYSGTEPILRIMVEGEDLKQVKGLAKGLQLEFERLFLHQGLLA